MAKTYKYRCSKCKRVCAFVWSGKSFRMICHARYHWPHDEVCKDGGKRCTMRLVPGQHGPVISYGYTAFSEHQKLHAHAFSTRREAECHRANSIRRNGETCSRVQPFALDPPPKAKRKR